MTTTGNPQDNNPYAAPSGAVFSATASMNTEAGLRAAPAVLPWGAGRRWVPIAWQLFKRAPGKLIVITLLYLLVAIGLGMIPGVGDLSGSLLYGFWLVGWVVVYGKLAMNEPVPVVSLFDGFALPGRGKLLLLGLIYLGGLLALVAMCAVAVLGFTGINPFEGDFTQKLTALMVGSLPLVIAGLFVFLIGAFVIYAYVAYAPMLVVFHQVPVMQACALSAKGFFGNWRALTTFGLWMILWTIACVFTLFIGFLVLLPVMMGAVYVSYRQIFVEGDEF